MVGDTELARLRADLESTLIESCVVVTLTRTTDGAGGTTTEETRSESIPCRRIPARGSLEREQGATLVSTQWLTVVLPASTQLTHDSRLEISGKSYEILGIDTTSPVSTRALCALPE